MGYEVKLYVVEKSDFLTKYGKYGKRFWGETVAMFDLCKVPEFHYNNLADFPDTNTFPTVGDKRIFKDNYGHNLKEIPLAKAVEMLKEIGDSDSWHYRRLKPCYDMLAGFVLEDWNNLVVLVYGY